jgi:hypothetical protein
MNLGLCTLRIPKKAFRASQAILIYLDYTVKGPQV